MFTALNYQRSICASRTHESVLSSPPALSKQEFSHLWWLLCAPPAQICARTCHSLPPPVFCFPAHSCLDKSRLLNLCRRTCIVPCEWQLICAHVYFDCEYVLSHLWHMTEIYRHIHRPYNNGNWWVTVMVLSYCKYYVCHVLWSLFFTQKQVAEILWHQYRKLGQHMSDAHMWLSHVYKPLCMCVFSGSAGRHHETFSVRQRCYQQQHRLTLLLWSYPSVTSRHG